MDSPTQAQIDRARQCVANQITGETREAVLAREEVLRGGNDGSIPVQAALAAIIETQEAAERRVVENDAMSKRTFLTCVSGDGQTPYLKVHFNNLADAHAAHDQLLGRNKENSDGE